jgi:hypothetical protein
MLVGLLATSETEKAGSFWHMSRMIAAMQKLGPLSFMFRQRSELLYRNEGIGSVALKVYDISSLMEMSSRMLSLSVSMDDVRVLLNRVEDRCWGCI